MTFLARLVIRYRWFAVAAWLLMLSVCVYIAPRFMEVTRGGGFDMPGSESRRAANILQDEFGQSYGYTVQLLFDRQGAGILDSTITDSDSRKQVEELVGKVMLLPGASESLTYYESGFPALLSPDGTATFALVTFSGAEEEIQKQIPVIRELARDSGDLRVYVVGGPAFDHDLEEASWDDLRTAETYALPAVAVILVFVFGSLVAAALPILLGGVSVTTTLAALYLLGHWTALSVFVLNMVTMLGLGLGIDYSLFIVSRFREELGAGKSPRAAVERTMATAGRAVVFSGAAVMIGMAMLVLFDIVFMRSLGIGGVLVAAFSVLAAITLLPAVLAMLKVRINAAAVITRRSLSGSGGSFWHRWSLAVMRKPVLFLVLSIGLLLALAWPVKDIRAGSPGVQDLSPRSDSRQGIELLAEKWSPGAVSPVYVVFDTGEACGVLGPGFRAGLDELGRSLGSDQRIESVDSIARLDIPDGLSCDVRQLEAWRRSDPESAAIAASLVNLKGAGSKTIARVLPKEPGGRETRELVRELRNEILPGIEGFSETEVLVGGSAAEVVDFTDMLVGAFPYLLVTVLLITYLMLLLLFRSLVLPLKAIFMNLLSVAAAYGVLVLVFQEGWGEGLLGFEAPGGILPFVPVILFSILFGLSMDYEVFLLSRIKEEYDRSGDNERSVALGLEKTGRIITTAALIMIVVFGSFALTRSIVIKEFGVGLAVSIFLDATIVRIIVVPATMKLLGEWNWWLPGWLDRLLPDFSLRH